MAILGGAQHLLALLEHVGGAAEVHLRWREPCERRVKVLVVVPPFQLVDALVSPVAAHAPNECPTTIPMESPKSTTYAAADPLQSHP